MCFFLRDANDSYPGSLLRESMDSSFVAPVTIRVARCCTFSSSLISYKVQLSQTTSEYSSSGLIKGKKDSLKRISIEFKLELSRDVYVSPCFCFYVI